ncbi:AAA family ATPase [Streptomyces sp. NPDC002054]|uniref:helix-turn-helix transcriptional regulator n=1 Tax=Streptomyces sp. NPDC002054 TaxID=3154663 RepID=UPI0033169549
MGADRGHGQTSQRTPALAGRARQWAVLEDAVTSAPAAGRALWLRGEAGIGKSALLKRTARLAQASGMRVLRVTGSEAEKDLPFAALHQLVWPLLERAGQLPEAARAALEAVMDQQGEQPGAGNAVSVATMELLSAAARERPLLILVDDLQWVDASSAEILQFIQRRLAGIPVVMVAAIRDEAAENLDSTDAQVLELEPLSEEEAVALLRERCPDVCEDIFNRLLSEAAGNPLALVELPAQLAQEQRAGAEPLPEHLPLGQRLERMFAARLAALTPAARFTLLLYALAGREVGPTDLVNEAARAAGSAVTEAELVAARDSGLIQLDADRGELSFRHPLVRAALVGLSPAAELRRAHRGLAAVLPADGIRQLTHLAAASVGPDEDLAQALEAAAFRTLVRGGDLEAATLLTRAAELSPDARGRARRLVHAASAAARGGVLAPAERLLAEADLAGVTAESRNVYDYTKVFIRFLADGDLAAGATLLPGVLARLTDDLERAALRMPALSMLIIIATYSADDSVWDAIRRELAADPDPIALLGHDLWHHPARHAHGGMARFVRLLETHRPEQEVAEAWILMWVAFGVDAVGDHAHLWERIAQRHAYSTEAYIDLLSAHDDCVHGRWDRLLERARLGVARARARGYGHHVHMYGYKRGYVLAARGMQRELDELLTDLRPWAALRRHRFILNRITCLQALCALSLGDYEAAYVHAASVTPPGEFPSDAPQFHLVFLDLVQAAVHCGRVEQARRHIAAGRAARMAEISPHHGFVLAAAEAVAAEPDAVDDACRAVYGIPRAEEWPFTLARVRLHHGAWLRRRRRSAEARVQLAEAQRIFSELGAGPWTERAEGELSACGGSGSGPAARPAPAAGAAAPAAQALTAQELRIAQLVATGLTNKEIGVRLSVSPRTVSTHLYKIFPKLGVTSRAGVARAMAGVAEPPAR